MMIRKNNSRKSNRRGAALIIALVLLLLVGTISASLIRGFYTDRCERDRAQIRAQAEMLRFDFAKRAEFRRAASPDFTGETAVFSEIAMFDGTFHLTSNLAENADGTTAPVTVLVEYFDSTNKLVYSSGPEISQ